MSERPTPNHIPENRDTVAASEVAGRSPEFEKALDTVREHAAETREYFEDFHRHPELGGEEYETAARVKRFLEAMGIEILGEEIGGSGEKRGTGIVAIIRGRSDGPTIALRADMDALPITESSDHAVRSERDGVMHACGHDAHTAGLLGAARALQELAKQGSLDGNAMLIFQPSEEKAHQKESGAVKMAREMERKGWRKNINAFLGLHVMTELDRGQVNALEGVALASSGEVDITLRGKGGHIINAYEQPNLHVMFSDLTLRLDALFRQRAQTEKTLVASARTTYEGSGYNVLAASGTSTWVIRVASEKYRTISAEILATIRRIVEEVIAKHDTSKSITATLQRRPGYRPVIHRDPTLVAVAEQSADMALGHAVNARKLIPAGEDFSFYLENLRGQEIPGVFMMVGAANPKKGIPLGPHHSPNFRIDPDVVQELSALHVAFTLNAIRHFRQVVHHDA